MRMNSKGQGAMEYLMTYGWAILVVIIVGIVLWQSGVFGTGSGGTSGFDKIRVRDYSYSSTQIQAKYENAAGGTIRAVNIRYTYPNGTSYAYSNYWNGNASSNWAPGKENLDLVPDTLSCANKGAGYSVDVSINYTSEAGIFHTEAGTLRGKCE
jgi:uncharacterized protein (UPF0333 family)